MPGGVGIWTLADTKLDACGHENCPAAVRRAAQARAPRHVRAHFGGLCRRLSRGNILSRDLARIAASGDYGPMDGAIGRVSPGIFAIRSPKLTAVRGSRWLCLHRYERVRSWAGNGATTGPHL
jgi:hypothetical protein